MNATFYVLKASSNEEASQTNNEQVDNLPAHFYIACQLAAQQFRNNKRVFILTDDETHAHLVDEQLWAFDANSFVPHNLIGEGPRQGAPVEIGTKAPTNSRQVLINLSQTVPTFLNKFKEVFDFVPTEETAKQQARERYKALRQMGLTLNTIDVNN